MRGGVAFVSGYEEAPNTLAQGLFWESCTMADQRALMSRAS